MSHKVRSSDFCIGINIDRDGLRTGLIRVAIEGVVLDDVIIVGPVLYLVLIVPLGFFAAHESVQRSGVFIFVVRLGLDDVGGQWIPARTIFITWTLVQGQVPGVTLCDS